MLFAHNLDRNGSPEQKKRFLPGACDGSKIGGMCMTEPGKAQWRVVIHRGSFLIIFAAGAGTDVMGMQTRAVPSADGSHFVLNGTKMFITNGTIDGTDTGDMFLVYAKTGSGRGMGDLSTFIVEKGMPGFKLGMKITDKCGNRGSNTAELVFEDVKVAYYIVEWILL
jgi:isovaleryl-CoA dehydrogenase